MEIRVLLTKFTTFPIIFACLAHHKLPRWSNMAQNRPRSGVLWRSRGGEKKPPTKKMLLKVFWGAMSGPVYDPHQASMEVSGCSFRVLLGQNRSKSEPFAEGSDFWRFSSRKWFPETSWNLILVDIYREIWGSCAIYVGIPSLIWANGRSKKYGGKPAQKIAKQCHFKDIDGSTDLF